MATQVQPDEGRSTLTRPLAWKGKGRNERGVDRRTGKTIVALGPRYLRPSEAETLLGDATKARKDLAIARREALVKKAGYAAPGRVPD